MRVLVLRSDEHIHPKTRQSIPLKSWEVVEGTVYVLPGGRFYSVFFTHVHNVSYTMFTVSHTVREDYTYVSTHEVETGLSEAVKQGTSYGSPAT